MRLLSTKTLELQEFSQDRVPNYATLSHRWREEEVSFQSLEQKTWRASKGGIKLLKCCERAREDGYDWVWIDTCCIDKTSSAELSEAINSMYTWYSKSSICYAYLEDIESSDSPAAMKSDNTFSSASGLTGFQPAKKLDNPMSISALEDSTRVLVNEMEDIKLATNLKNSEWFSRGWTLQELIAPRRVIFLDNRWKEFGTKTSLATYISPVTGIPLDILLGKSPLFTTIAQRMSWASKRQTTREEDIAYCLMGLFDIHMPPIYGEGSETAFLRLQEEILRRNSDQTLFLWSPRHEPYNQGLLATSPKAFCDESECFSSLLQTDYIPRNHISPYSCLTPVFHRSTKRSLSKDGAESLAQVSVAYQASLGSGGLQISLLQDDDLRHACEGYRLICLDVAAISHGPEIRVGLFLNRETEYDATSGFIPNRLGNMRRLVSAENKPDYYLIGGECSFTRTNMSISQVRTSDLGPGYPARFRLADLTTESFIAGITTIELDGPVTKLIRPMASFKCSGAVITVKHSCLLCEAAGGYEMFLGTRERAPPWCAFFARLQGYDMRLDYSKAEKLSARLYEQSIGVLKCEKRAIVQILAGPGDNSYVISLKLEG